MSNGAIQEGCCQVPLVGLRPQKGADRRGVRLARPLRSGTTIILNDYSLRPLDRRKVLRWRKQRLTTHQNPTVFCYALSNLGLQRGHMPMFGVMYFCSVRCRQKFWPISLSPSV